MEEDIHISEACRKEILPPCHASDQLDTRLLIAYLVIAVVFLLLFVYFLRSSLANYAFYAKDSGFVGPIMLIIGITLSFIILTYAVYYARSYSKGRCKTIVFWAFFVFFVSNIFWALNLSLRAEYYVKGQNVRSNGAFYLVLSLVSSLIVFYVLSCQPNHVITFLSFFVVLWYVYLLYNWWFRILSKEKCVKSCDRRKK